MCSEVFQRRIQVLIRCFTQQLGRDLRNLYNIIPWIKGLDRLSQPSKPSIRGYYANHRCLFLYGNYLN